MNGSKFQENGGQGCLKKKGVGVEIGGWGCKKLKFIEIILHHAEELGCYIVKKEERI